MKAQAMLPLVRSIPTESLYECYVLAMEAREPGNTFLVSGVEMLSAWKVLHERMEADSSGAYDKSRMLTANAVSVCPKCDGTGWERTPKGRKKGCDHAGWTPEFETELERSEEQRREDVRKQAEFMREALGKVGSPKPVAGAPKPKQVGTVLRCTNEACARKVTTLYGFEPGETCRELLNRGVHDGPLKFCDGTLEIV